MAGQVAPFVSAKETLNLTAFSTIFSTATADLLDWFTDPSW